MLTMTNPLTIEGFTVYQDDANEVGTLLTADGRGVTPPQSKRFYVLPETPTIAKDANGKPIFSLIVYRHDEDRIAPADAGKDVGGGILTFTVELAVPEVKFQRVRSRLRTLVYGDDATDPAQDVDLAYVPFLDGKVSVAVAAETGAEAEHEFVKNMVGTGKTSGVGANRKAVMVKLTQAGASLMAGALLDSNGQPRLNTLPINVQYELNFEHRLLGVTMRVWCDIRSSYTLIQEVTHQTDDYDDGYLGVNENHVAIDKITSITETMVRSKAAGVTVVPQTSLIDNETLLALEKFGFDMLNKEMEKALQASPPPAEIDRTYLESFSATYGNNFNFSLDRRMVLVRGFNPSANVANVFREGDVKEMVAFIDLRNAFFTFLKVPVRVNADFGKLPVDSVTVTVAYQRERFGGGGREEIVDSFDFKDGSSIQTFLAYANSLNDVTYDWSAMVHYKGSPQTYALGKRRVKDEFLVVDVGQLGMLQVDLGLGLVDTAAFPRARVTCRYRSGALGRTLEQSFLLNKENETALWTEVIHEELLANYEYKVDWLRKDGEILAGEWKPSQAARLRFDAPVPDQLSVTVICSGNFKDGGEQISAVGVTLRYHDERNHYTQEAALPAFTDDKQQQTWTVDLRDADLRTYDYKYSIVYKDGMVKEFPEGGGWLRGEPGFIVVGERYTVEVEVVPLLLDFPDHAKVVEVDLTYAPSAGAPRQAGSFVFSAQSNQSRTWRARGEAGDPKRYSYSLKYLSKTGAQTTVGPLESEAPVIVIPPLAAPAPVPAPQPAPNP